MVQLGGLLADKTGVMTGLDNFTEFAFKLLNIK